MRICLLGRFEVEWRGQRLSAAEWTRQKAASLLQRLAIERRLLKEQVIDELWPQATSDSGNNSFHQTMHLLRRTLDDALGFGCAESTFDLSAGVLRLDDSVRVDADEFERGVRESLGPRELEEALALYGGELLPAEPYAEWTRSPREHLRGLHREAVLRLAASSSASGDPATAIRFLLPLLDGDPADERVHRELMENYAISGHRHQALRQYRACKEALAEELGVDPEPRTDELYGKLLRGEFGSRRGSIREEAVPLATDDGGVQLVGRESELSRLLDRDRGSKSVLLVEGEAGVGKTRLVNEAAAERDRAGAFVLRGSAFELEGQTSYQCFIEAFDDFLERTPLAEASNPLSSYRPLGVSDPQQEHSALFRSVLDFLARLSAERTTLLIVDDLQAADESSIALFHYLARNAKKVGLHLLATLRRESKPSLLPFSRLVHSLYREGLAETISLEPLGRDGSDALIGALLGREPSTSLTRAVFEGAEGNPFFTLELTRAFEGAKEPLRQGSFALKVPGHLQGLLLNRVQLLGRSSESLLIAAAVLGRDFDFVTLRELTPAGDDELFAVLDGAITAMLLEDTGESYRFRHSLIRQALYDSLSSARRQWLHRRAAEALRRSEADEETHKSASSEAIAYHFERSDERQAAIPYLLQAGEKAASIYSLEAADDYFRQAEALLDEFGIDDRELRWAVYFARGWWGLILARGPTALGSIERALALPVDDVWHPGADALVRAHRIAARSLITAGSMAEAKQHLEVAGRLLSDSRSVDAADYYYDLALWQWHAAEPADALDTARRSMRIAEESGDEGARARALEMVALAGHSLGDAVTWQVAESRRSDLMGENTDVVELFDIHLCLWEYSLFGEFDYSAMREVVEATSRQAKRMGAVRADALCHCFLGALEFQAGRWSKAESALREGIEMYRKIGAAAGEAHCCHRLAILETARGNLGSGLQLLEDGIDAAARSLLRSHCLTRLYSVLIWNRIEAGDLEAAERALEAALQESGRHGNCNTCDSLLWPEAVSLRLQQGDPEGAAPFYDELVAAAERRGSPLWAAMLSRTRGELALAGGQVDEALGFYDAACAGFESVGFEFGLARSLERRAVARSRMDGPEWSGAAQADRVKGRKILERLLARGASGPE